MALRANKKNNSYFYLLFDQLFYKDVSTNPATMDITPKADPRKASLLYKKAKFNINPLVLPELKFIISHFNFLRYKAGALKILCRNQVKDSAFVTLKANLASQPATCPPSQTASTPVTIIHSATSTFQIITTTIMNIPIIYISRL